MAFLGWNFRVESGGVILWPPGPPLSNVGGAGPCPPPPALSYAPATRPTLMARPVRRGPAYSGARERFFSWGVRGKSVDMPSDCQID